ncbi:excinuclease ATPase subunit [Acidovorax sp.]|uniref:excinuclease ATPase subunit n=1 Tax=Acidovorax sp. TaxID=1872122 RepID=UPI002ACD93D6|nr:excinuclease ATPase subunit [Acidovorax sp.]MDZ7865141.1 excinuclease ATPase subunit [Acidovorax sp.]
MTMKASTARQLTLALAALAALAATPLAQARDKVSLLPLEEAVRLGIQEGKLDGSVKFYLSGAPTPPGQGAALGEEHVNRRTSNGGKEPVFACHWAALSGLIALQDSAKARGANAVVDLHSFFKEKTFKDPVNFECYTGNMMTGVTLKGTYVRTAP